MKADHIDVGDDYGDMVVLDAPTEPGWYWCLNSCDERQAGAEFVCHVFRGENGGLVCSWMTAPGEAALMHESEWSTGAKWHGPLKSPWPTCDSEGCGHPANMIVPCGDGRMALCLMCGDDTLPLKLEDGAMF